MPAEAVMLSASGWTRTGSLRCMTIRCSLVAFTSALNGASSCSERKRLDHSSSALERRTLQPGSSKMPWVSQSVKGLNGAGGGASMLRPSPHAAATEDVPFRSEEPTSELQSLMRLSYAVFCLKKKKNKEPTPQDDIRLKHN